MHFLTIYCILVRNWVFPPPWGFYKGGRTGCFRQLTLHDIANAFAGVDSFCESLQLSKLFARRQKRGRKLRLPLLPIRRKNKNSNRVRAAGGSTKSPPHVHFFALRLRGSNSGCFLTYFNGEIVESRARRTQGLYVSVQVQNAVSAAWRGRSVRARGWIGVP